MGQYRRSKLSAYVPPTLSKYRWQTDSRETVGLLSSVTTGTGGWLSIHFVSGDLTDGYLLFRSMSRVYASIPSVKSTNGLSDSRDLPPLIYADNITDGYSPSVTPTTFTNGIFH